MNYTVYIRIFPLMAQAVHAMRPSSRGKAGNTPRTLALDVHVETAPCHIAALPLAINMGCSAMRRATVELTCEPLAFRAQGGK